ncbi:hypothetical protein GCM10028805_27980 [Spirosoma harenae]
MKAYNEQWIYNREIADQAERWYRQKLLSDDQIAAVRKAYPVEFRQTNGFIEIGLFLFTTVAILACYLLPASMFSMFSANSTAFSYFNIISGIGIGIVGQFLINRRLLYRNGIDNAFVVTTAGFLAFGFNQLLPDALSTAGHCFLTLPLLLLILWYYGDTLMALFMLGTFYIGIFDGLISYDWGKDLLPFIIMSVSILIYLAVRQTIKLNPKDVYYKDPLNLAQWISLVMLAAGGNYFVVREVNGLLFGTSLPRTHSTGAPEISLAWLFWLLTFLIPAIYLWQGLMKRNRMLIILGVLGLIAAFMTLHNYAALVPLNVALTIGGLVLIGLAVATIRYLSKPKYGFTDAPDDDSPDEFFVNAANVAIVHATGTAQHSSKNDLRFGGGDFGGGGSEGKY